MLSWLGSLNKFLDSHKFLTFFFPFSSFLLHIHCYYLIFIFKMFLRSAFAYLFFGLAAVSARNPPKVYMIRHGEKPPNRDDHGLTLDGIKRAQCLRDTFGQNSDYNIGHIMAPTVKWSESRNSYHCK
jgi:hypothetical protein